MFIDASQKSCAKFDSKVLSKTSIGESFWNIIADLTWKLPKSFLEQLFCREHIITCFCKTLNVKWKFFRNKATIKAVGYSISKVIQELFKFFEIFKKPFRSLIRGSLLILLQAADCKPVTLKGASLKTFIWKNIFPWKNVFSYSVIWQKRRHYRPSFGYYFKTLSQIQFSWIFFLLNSNI